MTAVDGQLSIFDVLERAVTHDHLPVLRVVMDRGLVH